MDYPRIYALETTNNLRMQLPKISGVYMIWKTVTNAIYIGSSVNIHKRWVEHKREIRNGSHRNKYLQNAVRKYGIENFKFVVLEEIHGSRLKLYSREQYWIDYYNSKNYTMYNLQFEVIMDSLTEEARMKISNSKKGKPTWNKGLKDTESKFWSLDPETLYKLYMSGKTFNEVAELCNYNREGVRQIINTHIKENNLPKRKSKLVASNRVLQLKIPQVNYIMKLNKEGTTFEEIAILFGTSRTTLCRELCRVTGFKNVNEIRNSIK